MIIKKVTMTGADDSVQPAELVTISKYFPFVEWGILCSRNSEGGPRFPSQEWRDVLAILCSTGNQNLQLSGHICGAFVREFLVGKALLTHEIGRLWNWFRRVQINTHAQPHEFDHFAFTVAANNWEKKEYIFQYDLVNTKMIDLLTVSGPPNRSVLFDLSHGAGVLPEQWPTELKGIKCGYAGGLSPENIESQLQALNKIVSPDAEIWIDMETHVRSQNDKVFDLDKVRRVLRICQDSGFMAQPAPTV